jgi:hypothetical protein
MDGMAQATLTHPAPSIRDQSTSKGVLFAGAVMGALGGAAMLGTLMIDAALHGGSALRPLELLGASFPGSAVDVLGGVVAHLLVSAALGVPFAAVVPRDFPTPAGAVLGIGYAFLVIAVMTSWVYPAANPVLDENLHSVGGAWVIGRALFGAVLGLAPWLRRRLR